MKKLMLCALVALVCAGCGKQSSTDTHSSKSKKNHTVMLSENTMEALAGDNLEAEGPHFYTAEQVRAMDVGGVKLGMTQAEAEAALRAGGWMGGFAKLGEKTLKEEQTEGFGLDGKDLFVFRHRGAGGVVRVAEMRLDQRFQKAHNDSEIKEALIKKYGEPTQRVNSNELIWRTRVVKEFRGHPTDHPCHKVDIEGCPAKFDALVRAGERAPKLVAEVSPDSVRLSFSDEGMADADIAARKAEIDKATTEERAKNGKDDPVKF